jgi:hypothetical protein
MHRERRRAGAVEHGVDRRADPRASRRVGMEARGMEGEAQQVAAHGHARVRDHRAERGVHASILSFAMATARGSMS